MTYKFCCIINLSSQIAYLHLCRVRALVEIKTNRTSRPVRFPHTFSTFSSRDKLVPHRDKKTAGKKRGKCRRVNHEITYRCVAQAASTFSSSRDPCDGTLGTPVYEKTRVH